MEMNFMGMGLQPVGMGWGGLKLMGMGGDGKIFVGIGWGWA